MDLFGLNQCLYIFWGPLYLGLISKSTKISELGKVLAFLLRIAEASWQVSLRTNFSGGARRHDVNGNGRSFILWNLRKIIMDKSKWNYVNENRCAGFMYVYLNVFAIAVRTLKGV